MLRTSARFRVAGHVFSRPTCPTSVGPLLCLRPVAQTQCPSQKRTFSQANYNDRESGSATPRQAGFAENSRLSEHLNNLFAPLQFPPELASRILTHPSYKEWKLANNNRLSFVGRRVLNSFMLMFLQSSPAYDENLNLEHILQRSVETHALGEFVAPHWGVGRVMRWTPIQLAPRAASIGLYKIQGTTVEAVMGGIYHQFGGAVAHRVFHTRVLPHLLPPGKTEGLPDAFRDYAMRICEEMGGPQGSLLDAPPLRQGNTLR